MSDPRLNSLHVDPCRRQEFLRAREVLLGARGNETLMAERNHVSEAEPNPTLIRAQDNGGPATTFDFWLTDRDYVYPLKPGLNTLGRSSDNDVLVEDLYVS